MIRRGGALWALVLLGCDAAPRSQTGEAALDAVVSLPPAGEVCARYCGAFEAACGGDAAACEADCVTRASRARGACAEAFSRYFGCVAATPGALVCVGEGLATPGPACEAPLEAWRSCL